MRIYTLQLGELHANCYIVETAPSRCVAIDIGGSSRLFLEFIKMKRLTLSKILLTHGHFDHMGGVEEVRKSTGAEVFIHESDTEMLSSSAKSLHSILSIMDFIPVTEYTALKSDSYINDGDCSFKVMHTPGHTYGSVCYICDNVIFSGDTLFCCSCGRTDFPGGDAAYMKDSLYRLSLLEGDYKVYPGHNDQTTLDYERKNNPYMVR